MRSSNNSAPEICVHNLLRTARGEIPYDRVRGISLSSLDVPSALALDETVEDVEWMLHTYEPRVDIESVDITPTDAPNGHFAVTAAIRAVKEDAHE